MIPVDGPDGTAKMSKDDLLRETAQNALAGNVAPEFDTTTSYIAGQSVIYRGQFYTFKVDHSGAWDASHADATNIQNDVNEKIDEVGMYTRNTDCDLSFADEDANEIVRFENGHIKTKNFDSSDKKINGILADCDLSFADDENNEIVRFENGHIKTKNFDSSGLELTQDNDSSIVRADISSNLYDKFNSEQTDWNHYIQLSAGLPRLYSNNHQFWAQMNVATIEVVGGRTYTRNKAYLSDNNLFSACVTGFYDKDLNPLGGVTGDAGNAHNGIVTFTVPKNCKYVKCGIYQNYVSALIVNEGNSLSESVSFKKDIKESVSYLPVTTAYKNEIDVVINRVLDDLFVSQPDFIFAFFTDNHIKSSEKKVGTGRIIDYIDSCIPLDAVVFGGDILQQSNSTINDVYKDIREFGDMCDPIKNKMMMVQGNHETAYDVGDTTMISLPSKLSALLWNRNHKDYVYSSYSDFAYYKDFAKAKIRAIVLDWNNTGTDVENFVSSAVSTLPTGYKTILFTHYAYRVSTSVYSILHDSCIGVFSGHLHKDWSGTKLNYNGTDVGITMQFTACDSLMEGVKTWPNKRVFSDISCHAVDIVAIYFASSKVKSYRLGGYSNYSDEGQGISYDFDGISREFIF